MDFVPHTQADIERMMGVVGISSLEELFSDIPAHYRLKEDLDVPPPLAEQELRRLMVGIGAVNRTPRICLMGAGAYHHYIPAVVGHIVSRAEFYTAYTPYQAEISQGILQAIYEYQTMIASLTGMQVANASMYDGASAMAEAAVLAAKTNGRRRIITARSLHPEYRHVVATYAWANDYEIHEIPYTSAGTVDTGALGEAIDGETAAVLIQSPNFFGIIEDMSAVADLCRNGGAFLVAGFTDATALGILRPPGEMGADLVAGEGQAFGNPLSYGGPYLGILAGTHRFLRKIPGRLVGATVDAEGRRGYVLTLQTREQHIRRERATSNICSNEALCALAATVYLTAVGKNLKRLAEINIHKARYLRNRLLNLPGWEEVFTGPIYNEFILRCPDPVAVNTRLAERGILGGYLPGGAYPELAGTILLCATEMLTREDIDEIIDTLTR